MANTEPLLDWTEPNREQHLHQVMRGGWARLRPAALTFLLVGLALTEEPTTREDLKRALRRADNPEGELEHSCWEDPTTLDEEEQAEQPAQMETAERYTAHYGLPPLRTNADVLDLLVAAGVVHEVPDASGVLRLYPAHPLPAPADVFPLDEEEAAIQQQMRIDAVYEGDSYRIIELFEPNGERREEVVTSLDRLARLIDGGPHDAREAVRLLLEAGDFTTSLDITKVPPHKVFRLRCDWAKFDAERIGIHGMSEDGRLQVTLPADLQ